MDSTKYTTTTLQRTTVNRLRNSFPSVYGCDAMINQLLDKQDVGY